MLGRFSFEVYDVLPILLNTTFPKYMIVCVNLYILSLFHIYTPVIFITDNRCAFVTLCDLIFDFGGVPCISACTLDRTASSDGVLEAKPFKMNLTY